MQSAKQVSLQEGFQGMFIHGKCFVPELRHTRRRADAEAIPVFRLGIQALSMESHAYDMM